MKTAKTDFDLLKEYHENKDSKKKVLEEILKRYESTVTRRWKDLNNRLSKCTRNYVDKSTYFVDTFETISHAWNKVEISRIPEAKRPTWKFYICLDGYLRSFNRDWVHAQIKKAKNERSMYTAGKDGDEMNILDINGKATEMDLNLMALKDKISQVEKSFTPLQQKIFKYKFFSKDKVDNICATLNISHKEYGKQINIIKKTLRTELNDFKEL